MRRALKSIGRWAGGVLRVWLAVVLLVALTAGLPPMPVPGLLARYVQIPNAWRMTTQDGASFLDIGTNGQWTWTFKSANTEIALIDTGGFHQKYGYLRLATSANTVSQAAGAPTGTECDASTEIGRLYMDTTNKKLYLCFGTAGWFSVTLT